jgi:hypothetical protein
VTTATTAAREETLCRNVIAVISACVSGLQLRLRLRQHHHLRLRLLHLLLHELLLKELLLHLRAVIRHRGRGQSHVLTSTTIHTAVRLRAHTSTATTTARHPATTAAGLLATIGSDELVEVTPRQDVVSRRSALEAFGHGIAVSQGELLLVVLDARIVVHRRRCWDECEGISGHVLSLFLSASDGQR